jgi:hypothetical protein
MKIINYTTYPVADALETLADVLSISPDTVLRVKQTPQAIRQGDSEFLGLVQPVEHSPRLYDLYLSPGVSASTLPKVLAHECVHLAQYASGRLSVQGSTVMFDGKEYKYNIYDSFSPWEDEAFKTQAKLLKLIKR